MSARFNPRYRLIIVKVLISGPADTVLARLALDTGASVTTLSLPLVRLAGYDPDAVTERVLVTTGSGAELVPRLAVERIEALGHARTGFPVLCHTLPSTVTVDGLPAWTSSATAA